MLICFFRTKILNDTQRGSGRVIGGGPRDDRGGSLRPANGLVHSGYDAEQARVDALSTRLQTLTDSMKTTSTVRGCCGVGAAAWPRAKPSVTSIATAMIRRGVRVTRGWCTIPVGREA